jgi:hypothetical protein
LEGNILWKMKAKLLGGKILMKKESKTFGRYDFDGK